MDIDVKTTPGRSTCLSCGRKKERSVMVKHGQHWTCKTCLSGGQATDVPAAHSKLRVLNLYAGIGGNRALWPGNILVTAVEKDVRVAAAYQKLYPNDVVICADAHNYLLKHYSKFDFVWSSPPCPSHSRMNFSTTAENKRYVDFTLYQEIILLQSFCNVKYVVENVIPYYTPLVKPDYQIGRHLFWTNCKLTQCHIPQLDGFIDMVRVGDKQKIMDWLGIHIEEKLYLSGKNPIQVFRNCVHPKIGLSIFNDAFGL